MSCLVKQRTLFMVSQITGLEYGMGDWNGKWNGTVDVNS